MISCVTASGFKPETFPTLVSGCSLSWATHNKFLDSDFTFPSFYLFFSLHGFQFGLIRFSICDLPIFCFCSETTMIG